MSGATKNYGLNIITGNFGSGKTFGLGTELYKQKEENPNVCIISNVPRSITDVYYNSIDDFQMVLQHMYMFFEETNEGIETYNTTWKDIILVMDESQIYFPARGFADKKQKELREILTIILTQCRKRYTKIYCAVQRTKMLDINFRRLADYIRFYFTSRAWGINFCRLHIFECSGAIDDLIGDDSNLFSSEEKLLEMDINDGAISRHMTDALRDLLAILNPKRKIWHEQNITKHISGMLKDEYKLTYEEFRKKLYLDVIERPRIEIKNQDMIPIFQEGMEITNLFGDKVIKHENRYERANKENSL